ncbi:MAG: hypothetical protein HC884_15110 [Chloroflexaceae bacterium]|nr:hypothetical protein [Chloroflexaceae bacterium]
MPRIRFILVEDQQQKDQINWKRFFSGSMVAIGLVLIAVTIMSRTGGERPSGSSPPGEPLAQEPPGGAPSPGLATSLVTFTVPLPVSPMVTATPVLTDMPPPATDPPRSPPDDPPLPSPTNTPQSSPTNASLSPPPLPPARTGTTTPGTTGPVAAIEATPTPTTPTVTLTAPATLTATSMTTQTASPETPALTATVTATPTPTASPETPTPTSATDETATAVPTPIATPVGGLLHGAGVIREQFEPAMVTQLREAHILWAGYHALSWSELEVTQGDPDWGTLDDAIDDDLQAMYEQGITPMMVVRGTPDWAKKYSNASCSPPPREDMLDTLAEFMNQTVEQFQASSHRVRYWVLGSDPDVDPTRTSGYRPFGWCWGDHEDEDYGGAAYAEMLKQVYPAIKRADSDARVVMGGLLLECDPDHPAADDDTNDEECSSSRFLEGVLKNGGGTFFDILAYQSTVDWEPGEQDWDLEDPAWQERGGALLGKRDFIQEVLERYDIEKPVLVSRAGLRCDHRDACDDEAFLEDQTNYVVRTYLRVRASEQDVLGLMWYPFNYTDEQPHSLLDRNGAPRPAYRALSFLAGVLDEATFDRKLANENQESYTFRSDTHEYQVHWTNDGSIFPYALPASTDHVYTFGTTTEDDGYETLDLQGVTAVDVGFHPVLIVVQP